MIPSRLPRQRAFAALAVLVLCASLASRAAAQQAPGTVRGTVTASGTGEPLALATVFALGAGRSTTTDESGRFVIAGIAAGPQRLRIRLIGYRPVERDVEVPAGGDATLAVSLDVAPVSLNEVRVLAGHGDRERFERTAEVGTFSIGGGMIGAVPAVGEADVMRTVQLLPGVLGRHDYTAGYNVRGGESDQNLVLLDGYPVYNPFHLGGLFGTFLEATVQDATLHTGGYPASYGGRLSSVLEVTSREEARRGVHGEVSTSLLATSAAVGGLLADARTSWNVAARRTYADLLAPLAGRSLPYHFRDAQLHLSHLLPWGGTLALTAYDGVDVLDGELPQDTDSIYSGDRYRYDWGNTVVGLAWTQPLGERTLVTQRLSRSRFGSTLDLGSGSRILFNRLTDLRLAGSLTTQLGAHRVGVGHEWSRLETRFYDRSPRTTVTLQNLAQGTDLLALWADDVWQVSPRLLLRPGVRVERASAAGETSVLPRASAKFFLRPDLALSAAAGRAGQAVHSLRREDTPVNLFDYWMASDRHVPVSYADHLVAGAERWFGSVRLARIEAFHKRYRGLVEADPADDPIVRGDEFRDARGRSYGIDVLVRQLESERLGGWIAYTWTVASRAVGDTAFWAAQDRRHNLNVVASWQQDDAWTWSARFAFGSGTPYTPIAGQLRQVEYDPLSGEFGNGADRGDLVPVGGDRNGRRLPNYHRLDLGISRVVRHREVTLIPSLQVVNVYNRHNVFRYSYDYTDAPPTRKAVSQLPLLPTLGLTVEF